MTESRADVLLVEDTPSLSLVYRGFLSAEGIASDLAETGKAALAALAARRYRVVVLDLVLPDMDGFDVLSHIQGSGLDCTVVIITAQGSLNVAVQAMQRGASDFLVKPFARERLFATVRNALERTTLREDIDTLRQEYSREHYHGFIGSSLVMQAVYRAIDSVAASRASVFICGESGTGKEVCAEAIHRAGSRTIGPFIPLNCGAIPKDLVESELFGHVKGAFTGATTDRDGAAQLADGGTLFLDEICEMELGLQVKLLRFLQTGRVQKVGSSELKPVNVRVLAATNRDPLEEVEAGRFREDLYYRLHVVPITLPPLRDRNGDVLEIAQALLARMSEEEGKAFRGFTEDAEEALLRHHWPGNVRELQNVIRNAVVLNTGDQITAGMLSGLSRTVQPMRSRAVRSPAPAIAGRSEEAREPVLPASTLADATVRLNRSLAEIERDAIETTIRLSGGSIPKAARVLEISPSTIYRKKETWDST